MFVGLGRSMTTRLADEFRLADAILACCVPTGLAAVGGGPGVDLNPGAPSLFRFGAQNRDELSPARVAHAPVEPGLRPRAVGQILAGVGLVGHGFGPANHVGDLEILHHDQVIPPDGPAGGLVVKILALVSDLAMPGDNRFPPTVAVSSTSVVRVVAAAALRPDGQPRNAPSGDC